MKEIWTVYNKGADFKKIGEKLKIDPVVVRVMRNRDLNNLEEMEKFLGKSTFTGYDGAMLKDMDRLVDGIVNALIKKKRIRIISDYDVDGIMSNFVLYKGLKVAALQLHKQKEEIDFIDYVIPHRMKDGYGLSKGLIEDAIKDQVEVILTCDNGIAAMEEVAYAKDKGLTVWITDHHEVQKELPKADAIVDPKQEDCMYPFSQICGAVVAYKVIEQLYKKCGISETALESFQVYIAIATVCDVMVLKDENRFIVKRGIALLKKQMREKQVDCGLQALLDANEITEDSLSSFTFGFTIGPCLNASGRLSTALWGLRLLLETNPKKARWRALRLTQMNAIRKEMSRTYEKKACDMIGQDNYQKDKVLVLYLPGCHESIAGIIAGRVREQSGKPTLVVTDAMEEGIIKGSGRSIPEYDMFSHLLSEKSLFTNFGGHPMAAGFSLKKENLDTLRIRLNENCNLTENDIAIKRHIDVVMPLEYISEQLIQDLKVLEPFGNGNEKPVFAVRNVELENAYVCGAKKNVVRMQLKTEQGVRMNGVYFNNDPLMLFEDIKKHGFIDIEEKIEKRQFLGLKVSAIYEPKVNEYMGKRSLELKVISLKYQE